MLAAFIALTIFASLNRETGLIVPALFWACYGFDWRRLALLVLTWGAVTAGLHLVLGAAPHMLGAEGTLAYNLDTLGDGLMVNAVLVPLWIALARGWKCAPAVLKRFAAVGLAYLAAILVGGSWSEMLRLALPVLILTLPVVLRGGYEAPAR